MKNKTEDEIKEVFGNCYEKFKDNYEIINSYVNGGFNRDEYKNISVKYLSQSIDYLAQADAACFCKGWENARGCKIEHEIAKEYQIPIIYVE